VSKLFSILHTSARPDKWRAVYDDWMSKCATPSDVEYVLCIDPRWGFSLDPNEYDTPLDNLVVVQNVGRRCYVDGVATAAKASTGTILIVNADDQFACERWDREIVTLMAPAGCGAAGAWNRGMWCEGSFVIEVSTGTPNEHDRGVMVMPILSRARYEALGHRVFWPEYESMFADNDFCEEQRLLGGIIDARHLMFPHRHALFTSDGQWKPEGANNNEKWDEAYAVQNRRESHELGHNVYARRKAAGFRNRKRSIALCLSGERFEGPWVDGLLNLYGHLVALDFEIIRLREFTYTTNVYITREDIRRTIMNLESKPELCLWLDDDNILTPEHFDRLLAGIDAHPETDGVSGWCWIHDHHKRRFSTSCGLWSPDHLHWMPFSNSMIRETELKPFETGGLPCILMRYSALVKAGEGAFLPILDSRFEHGISGEDMAFFLRAEKGGATFLVDPQVRVPHLKYVEVEPIIEEEGRTPVKIACMMRVKNEARWIARTIQSVKELCGADIYVMEDGSTDDTFAIAEACGAVVLKSPFDGMELNEVRDKNWLLAEVKKRCNPDWIFMPDGDEELAPGGCASIRRACELNPPIDIFAVRFLYLWNSVDTIRMDGVYGSMLRQSLFRANSKLEFKSYYEGQDGHNHVGLHCSNAPGIGGNARVSP
jgi:hypothetical protein